MASGRVILISLLLSVVSLLELSAQNGLPWYYSFPNTEEGRQKRELIDLYSKKGDFANVKIVSSYASTIEPGCFYFADAYVQSSYNLEQGAVVAPLSDSLVKSELATPQTFLYNAWIHDWQRDKRGAIEAIDNGLEMYPEDFGLLRGGMKLASDYQYEARLFTYGQKLLVSYPNDWQTYYDFMRYYDEKKQYDYTIILADLSLVVAPNNPKNVEIKYKLMDNYNRWLEEEKPSKTFTSLHFIPDDLPKVSSMDDLIKLQSFMAYAYAKEPNSNYLERRLFDFKLKVVQKCNWIAYCYDRYGISIFPQEYESYLSRNSQSIPELNNCISNIQVD